jgi:hypothetical protein
MIALVCGFSLTAGEQMLSQVQFDTTTPWTKKQCHYGITTHIIKYVKGHALTSLIGWRMQGGFK